MYLTCIVGPMFAGKTSRLRRVINDYGPLNPLVVKPRIDNRAEGLNSHDGWSYPAVSVSDVSELSHLYWRHDDGHGPAVLVVDDAQFLPGLAVFVRAHREDGCLMYVAGLDLDYTGAAWEDMAELLAEADRVEKRAAGCAACGAPARMTQRLIDGKPAPLGPRILVGGAESYEPRCRNCWQPPAAE